MLKNLERKQALESDPQMVHTLDLARQRHENNYYKYVNENILKYGQNGLKMFNLTR